MASLKYWLWLASLPGVGGVMKNRLLEHFGGPEEVYCSDSGEYFLVEGMTREIHRLFRQYPGVQFYSMDYYRTYQKRLYINNMIVTDCSRPVADIIELLQEMD